jgi:type IV secretory pathway TrbD component
MAIYTSVPTLAFGLTIALLMSVAVICIYRGTKNKNDVFYAASGLFCFLSFGFFCFYIGQYILGLIVFGISVVPSLIITRKIIQINAQISAKKLAKVAASEPIQLKEVFSDSFFIKLERKYGERKALLIVAVGGVAIASPVLVAMVLLHIATWYHVTVWGLGFGIIIWLSMYRQMKKELQRMKECRSA